MANITVGLGTEVQVVINMTPITGENGLTYSLGNLDWSIVFTGNSGAVTIQKSEATKIDDNSYECLVKTASTGVSENLIARLTVKGIPTSTGSRTEVTPEMFTNIEVM